MDFIRAWAMSLSAIIIFGSMCEMILPDGAYKKYVHLAIGLMLVMSVLKPVTDREIEFSPEITAEDYKSEVRANIEYEEDVINIYKAKLTESVKKDTGLYDSEIKWDINEDASGGINKIYIKTDKEITPGIMEILTEKYGLTEDKIEIKGIGRGEGYET